MPDLNKTRELLEAEFIAGWASTLPISHDNKQFDDTVIDAFVSMRFINYTSKNVTLGVDQAKRKRHEGVLSIKIYVKQNTGTGEAYDYADQISEIMGNINLSNLLTNASEVRRNGETKTGWFGLIVDSPYISDEV